MPTDDFILTVRLFDPIEKNNSKKAASWGMIKVPRADVNLPEDQFLQRYVVPALRQTENRDHTQQEPAQPTLINRIFGK